MKIEKVGQPEFRMTFAASDGWAILAALKEYTQNHPDAVEVKKWQEWANDLDKQLRCVS